MAFSAVANWLLCHLLANTRYKATRNKRNPSPKSSHHDHELPPFPTLTKLSSLEGGGGNSQTLVCDIDGTLLLRSRDRFPFFPYFMLVAFEGGSILRAFLLLLSSPILLFLGSQLKLKVMIFVTFCGMRVKDMESVGRAVLPKFYHENLNLRVYHEVLASRGCRVVVFTSVPRVMVEGFLKDYLDVSEVVGTELQTVGPYFTGFLSGSGLLLKHMAVEEFFGERKPDIGIGTSSPLDHIFLSLCKEAYVVNNEENKGSKTTAVVVNQKDRIPSYPKPVVFHDGRLAFFPTPLPTLSMFLWLPLGITLALFRISAGNFLPYNLAIFTVTLTGVKIRTKGFNNNNNNNIPNSRGSCGCNHVLYVCNHRTLMDPVFLSVTLRKPLTAVSYSLSKMSELISPIRTVRLTRERKQDGETMERLLSEGDVVVCPEGTTCREPYLLRFSSLFAELTDEIVPVAVNTHVTMFHGTTASGLKFLDPIFFLMNPRPSYYLHVLGKVPREMTCGGGGGRWSSFEVANYVQKMVADALGFQCTTFTRRDKYMMLAGNEGVVKDKRKKS